MLRAAVSYSQITEGVDTILSCEKGFKLAETANELYDESQRRRKLATTYEEITVSLLEKAASFRAKEMAQMQVSI